MVKRRGQARRRVSKKMMKRKFAGRTRRRTRRRSRKNKVRSKRRTHRGGSSADTSRSYPTTPGAELNTLAASARDLDAEHQQIQKQLSGIGGHTRAGGSYKDVVPVSALERKQRLAREAAKARLAYEVDKKQQKLQEREQREQQEREAAAAARIQARYRGQAARQEREKREAQQAQEAAAAARIQARYRGLDARGRAGRFESLSAEHQSLGIDEALKRDDEFQLNKSAKAQAEMARREAAAALDADAYAEKWWPEHLKPYAKKGELAHTFAHGPTDANKPTEGDYGSVVSTTTGPLGQL
jgi:hypothetical protein